MNGSKLDDPRPPHRREAGARRTGVQSPDRGGVQRDRGHDPQPHQADAGEGLIQFTVVTDFRMAGSPNLVMFGIQAEPARVSGLARELSQLRELNCVIVLLGRYSILAMGLFAAIEQVEQLITDRIRSLDGVLDVETSISVHNLKYEAGMARITRATED